MRRTIAAAAALAAIAVPATASAAGHTFTGQCNMSGLDFYGPSIDAPQTQHLGGMANCTGSLDGGPQTSILGLFSVDHTGAMVKIADGKTSGPLPARVLLLAASGHGRIAFGLNPDAPSIGFTSTQSLLADVMTGDAGGIGLGTVQNSGTGEPDLHMTFQGLAG